MLNSLHEFLPLEFLQQCCNDILEASLEYSNTNVAAALLTSYSRCNRVWMLETFQLSMWVWQLTNCWLKYRQSALKEVGYPLDSWTSEHVSYRGHGQISNDFPVLSPADGLPALSFSISTLTLIGMLAVITYTVSWDLRQVVDDVSCGQWYFIGTVIKAIIQCSDFQILPPCSLIGPLLIEISDIYIVLKYEERLNRIIFLLLDYPTWFFTGCAMA